MAGPGRAEDLALVERVRQGELGAFEELYRAHAGKLFSVACRMIGNPTDAEDLLQEIFLSAHRKLESFRGESALGIAEGTSKSQVHKARMRLRSILSGR